MITGRLGLRISHTRVDCLDVMNIVALSDVKVNCWVGLPGGRVHIDR